MTIAQSEIKPAETQAQTAPQIPSDVVFVSMESWDEIWRRNQFLVAEFARRSPGRRILFVGLDTDVTNNLRNGRIAALRAALSAARKPRRAPDFENVFLLNPIKWLPNTLAVGRKFNEWIYRRQARAACREIGIENPLLWLNPHYAVHMVGRMGENAVIYDITDDWTQIKQGSAIQELIVAQDAELCRRADAVIVCSEKLYELKRGMTRHLTLIANGVDSQHYRRVLDSAEPLPPETQNWERPVFGYTGTIHPDRVDIGLVETLSKRIGAGTIALIGPNMLREQDMARLRPLKNVILTGPIPYIRLPDFMRAFDVCITPHCMTPFTESLNPIKLWEYLAAGKPIVSTNVAGFRDYPDFVYCADNSDAFLAALQTALREAPALREARRSMARQHSWAARADAALAVVTEAQNNRETQKAALPARSV